jgi:flagellar L-ring protein precursor FlgH
VISLKPQCVAAAVVLAVLAGCATKPPKVDKYEATLPEDVPVATASNGSIYQSGHDLPLFENAIARRVGDTITINLVENTTAQKSSSTTTAKKTSVDVTAPTIGGKVPIKELALGMGSNNTFDGSGDSALSNKLQGSVTVTVAQRLSNGNLVVRGQKWININQGREFVRIQGIIRPIDIQPDNTIASYKVADATISYGGQGALADANRPGLLARFFNSRWNPL